MITGAGWMNKGNTEYEGFELTFFACILACLYASQGLSDLFLFSEGWTFKLPIWHDTWYSRQLVVQLARANKTR